MYDEVEKALIAGGVLFSTSIGNLCGFWYGVATGGGLLFAVAFLVFMASLATPSPQRERERG